MKGRMQKRLRDILTNSIVATMIAFLILVPLSHVEGNVQGTRSVTDRIGRTVKVPLEPKRIACFLGPSYEKIFLLGSADRVAVMSIRQPPWAQKLNPNLKKIPLMPSYSDPDVERILELGVDLVIYWQFPQQIEKMSAAGIPVVCPLSGDKLPTSMEEFIQGYKEEIRFYGEVLGEKAKKIANAYCDYYDKKISRVLSVTSKISASQRPKVYYITGRNVFGTQGRYSLGHWLVEMAGGTFVAKDLSQYFVDVSMEQIIAWNPDVIVVGGLTSADAIMTDPRWQGIKAVKEKKIYIAPEGVFYWGHGSSEVFLFVMYLAKILHPEQFRELNLEQEVKDYYAQFYHYNLNNDEVIRILNHLPPPDFGRH
jgi:iron complex transport system substrate-binding protein